MKCFSIPENDLDRVRIFQDLLSYFMIKYSLIDEDYDKYCTLFERFSCLYNDIKKDLEKEIK